MPKSMSKSEFPASISLLFFLGKIVKMQWQCEAFALDHLFFFLQKKKKMGQCSVVEEEH